MEIDGAPPAAVEQDPPAAIEQAPPGAVEQDPPAAIEQAPPDAVEQVPPHNDVDGDVAETLLLLRLDTPPGHFTSNSSFTSTCALLGCCIRNPGSVGSYCCRGHSELAVLWSSGTLRAYHVYYGYANTPMRDEISCTIVIHKEGGIEVGVPTLQTGKVFDVVPWENESVFSIELREGERNRDWFFFARPPAAYHAMTNEANHSIKWHLNGRKARTFDEKEVFVTLGTLTVENNPGEKERRKVWRLYWYQRGEVSLYCLSYVAQNVLVPKLGPKMSKPKRDDKKPDDDMEEDVKSKDLKSKDPNCSAKGKRSQKNTGELGKGIALGHVHGVLHRDAKPHTFLMDPKTMRLKIADHLGLARAFTLPMHKYTLEVNAALKACTDLKLDALVIIEACTNLFQLVGVPVTINGDLKNQFVEPNVGFDTTCKGTTACVELGDGTTVAKAGDAHIIARSFPHTLGQPLAHFLRANSKVPDAKIIIKRPAIRVEIVFSGRQAPGGHNIIWGLYEALKVHNSKNTLLGFFGGSEGLFAQKTLEITDDVLQTYKNQGGFDLLGGTKDQIRTTKQVNAALKACTDLKLDGLVIIGGVTSNTDAAHLAEFFAEAKCPTKIVGVPVTINGDLKNQFVEANIGFDIAEQSCDTVQARAGQVLLLQDKNHGVILIPEASMPELFALLKETHGLLNEGVHPDRISTPWSSALFEFRPPFMKKQLLLHPESDDSAELSQAMMTVKRWFQIAGSTSIDRPVIHPATSYGDKTSFCGEKGGIIQVVESQLVVKPKEE